MHVQSVATYLKYSARSLYYKDIQTELTDQPWSEEKEKEFATTLRLRAPPTRAITKSACTLIKEVLNYHQRFC